MLTSVKTYILVVTAIDSMESTDADVRLLAGFVIIALKFVHFKTSSYEY